MKYFVFAGLLATAAVPAMADDAIPPVVGGKTWTQQLVTRAKATHPEIFAMRVEAPRDGRTVVLGSTLGTGEVFKPAARPLRGKLVSRPFVNVSGNPIGTVSIAFAPSTAATRADAVADEVAAMLSKHVLSIKNAVDPWPYDVHFSTTTNAQRLVDRVVAAHPELLVMAIHATPPGKTTNIIIGSTIGRIGKIADEDDLRIINAGTTNLEVAESGDRFETELPLNDASGKRIGALGLVFRYAAGDDKDALHAKGRAIRDELAVMIPANAALFAR